MDSGITVFQCRRGLNKERFVELRIKADPKIFVKFKNKIKNEGYHASVHDLFNKFMEDYVNEPSDS